MKEFEFLRIPKVTLKHEEYRLDSLVQSTFLDLRFSSHIIISMFCLYDMHFDFWQLMNGSTKVELRYGRFTPTYQ